MQFFSSRMRCRLHRAVRGSLDARLGFRQRRAPRGPRRRRLGAPDRGAGAERAALGGGTGDGNWEDFGIYPAWLCQQFAIEKGTFIVDLPIENGDFP